MILHINCQYARHFASLSQNLARPIFLEETFSNRRKKKYQNLIGCENNSTGGRGRDERWGGRAGWTSNLFYNQHASKRHRPHLCAFLLIDFQHYTTSLFPQFTGSHLLLYYKIQCRPLLLTQEVSILKNSSPSARTWANELIKVHCWDGNGRAKVRNTKTTLTNYFWVNKSKVTKENNGHIRWRLNPRSIVACSCTGLCLMVLSLLEAIWK